MKSALFLLLLSAFIATISSLPAPDEETDQPAYPWYGSYSYQFMMCRLKCRQNCLEQGYWKGVCKQGACYCYGPMGPYGKVNGFPISMY